MYIYIYTHVHTRVYILHSILSPTLSLLSLFYVFHGERATCWFHVRDASTCTAYNFRFSPDLRIRQHSRGQISRARCAFSLLFASQVRENNEKVIRLLLLLSFLVPLLLLPFSFSPFYVRYNSLCVVIVRSIFVRRIITFLVRGSDEFLFTLNRISFLLLPFLLGIRDHDSVPRIEEETKRNERNEKLMFWKNVRYNNTGSYV